MRTQITVSLKEESSVPAGYDEELTVHYGDWRKPPEDKDAFVHHADLEE